MLQEGIERLRHYGYSSEEAHFLTLAALHAGYFVRRQFNEFLNQERGGNAQRFIEKLTARHHVQCERYLTNFFVYHIRAKGIYNRLGQVDNRNRRERAPFTVKRKLMCLDFVLAHRDRRFLETEAEKVAYFMVERGVDIEFLPGRRYQSRRTTEATERFFVEKLPIFVDESSRSAPVVHFAYVDEGAQSIEGFATFLTQYRQLLDGLGQIEVAYVAAEPRWFAKAESTFRRIVGVTQDTVAPLAPDAAELIEYFETRRKFEKRDFGGLDTERIVRYREQKRTFAADHHEQLYRQWLEGGTAAVFPRSSAARKTSFCTYLLNHDYEAFGGLRNAS
jgi:hypothetical protein